MPSKIHETNRRTTPLLEYIKNRKLEKQVRSDFCLKFHIYISYGFLLDNLQLIIIELFREYEKRKEKNEGGENWRRNVCGRKRKGSAEKKKDLLKKPEKGDELASEKHKEKGEESSLKEFKEKSQNDSDKEQRDLERRFREKEPERQRYRLDDGRKHRTHYEFDKFMRRNEEELKWGKGYNQDRGKKGNYSYSFTVEAVDKLGKEDKCDDMASKKEYCSSVNVWILQYCIPAGMKKLSFHQDKFILIAVVREKQMRDQCDQGLYQGVVEASLTVFQREKYHFPQAG
uniref:UPF3A regulator of nonsense mediated mRNA decay n=1 Tax=Zosterops lateralis melanops TaxID=1220523 RepID=A0A8D2NS27_ZOSLA